MSVAAVQPQARRGRSPRVVVVGAGFGGIATAIELRRHGITDVTILEKAPDLGGTWFYNSYPGAACDVPSHLYSFSYAQRRNWSRLCSPQREIHSYLHDVAASHRVRELIHTSQRVSSCEWQEGSCSWSVATEQGETHEADVLVLATGQLHQPHRPPIEGADSFAGRSFHSSEWDHGYRLAGRRVGVIGTGASAVQFIPEIAREAASLSVFQRTANWFLPRINRPYPRPMRTAFELLAPLQQLRRRFVFEYAESLTLAIRNPNTVGRIGAARSAAFMRSQISDPELRRKIWPDYTFGCKRILFSSAFLPALERPNVELVTDAISAIVPEGVVTADGTTRELDCIVWATGFKTNDFMLPMPITGRAGVHLSDEWASGAHAYLGMCVPSFPNMFVLYGPNTNTSGGSIVFYLETQAAYLRQAVQLLRARGAGAIEVRPEIEHAFNEEVQRRFAGTAWTECDSWYRNEQGRIIANWPGYMREYARRLARLDANEFVLEPLPAAATAAAG